MIVNNTIDGNFFHGIHIGQACGVVMYNNIISYHNQYGLYDQSSGCSINENFNLFWGNMWGYMGPYTILPRNSKFADPRFYFTNDYHLECGSAAINNGTNTPPGGLSAADIGGDPRIFGGAVDIGAYERQGACNLLYLPLVVR